MTDSPAEWRPSQRPGVAAFAGRHPRRKSAPERADRGRPDPGGGDSPRFYPYRPTSCVLSVSV